MLTSVSLIQLFSSDLFYFTIFKLMYTSAYITQGALQRTLGDSKACCLFKKGWVSWRSLGKH